jgi:hypothetical protein
VGWRQQESNIAFAITQSWRLPATATAIDLRTRAQTSFADWGLADAVENHADIIEDEDSVARKARIRRLADLLELRGLVWIFFMLCNPDSSDVYLMADENVSLPMV